MCIDKFIPLFETIELATHVLISIAYNEVMAINVLIIIIGSGIVSCNFVYGQYPWIPLGAGKDRMSYFQNLINY